MCSDVENRDDIAQFDKCYVKLIRAEVYLSLGRYEETETICKDAAAEIKTVPECLAKTDWLTLSEMLIAESLVKCGDADAALQRLDSVVLSVGNYETALFMIPAYAACGVYLSSLGLFDEADASF